MKETINVNIAGQAFTMDMDAYSALTTYLDDIGRRLPEGDTETLTDIEARIAEIFREKVPSPMMVVTLSVVESTIEQLGAPETFGQTSRRVNSGGGEAAEPKTERGKLYRSRSKRILAGVCGGIADYFGIDTLLVRVVFVVFALCGSISFWIYLLLWLLAPKSK